MKNKLVYNTLMKRFIVIAIASFLVSLPSYSQLSISYQKNKGQKSKTSWSYQNQGISVKKSGKGFKMKIGPFDQSSNRVQRAPASISPFYQRALRGSSHHQFYDNHKPTNQKQEYPYQKQRIW